MTLKQDAFPAPSKAGFALRAANAKALGLAVYLLLGGLTLSPLLWARIPALVDYPNHLARMWILVHGGDIPALASNYVAHWRLVPDLAMDLIVPPLAHLIGVELAGRVFIGLTMVTLVAGTIALHRVLYGRIGLWPLASLLFVYNAVLYWGFLNCLFGMGIALLLFAAWIATRAWPSALRIPLFAAAASVLFCLHLFAFGFYGLIIASYEAANVWRARPWSAGGFAALCRAGLQFVPGLLLWWASLGNGGPSLTRYGSFAAKAYAALAPTTFGAQPLPVDRVLLVFVAVFWLATRLDRSLKLAPAMQAPLVVVLAASLLMPHWVSGSALADIRLPAILPFLLIAATRLDAPKRRLVAPCAAVAMVFLALRVWIVSETWRDYDAQFAEFRAADHVIAPGSRLLVVAAPLPEGDSSLAGLLRAFAVRQDNNFNHMAALAVIDRSAFIPFLFTGWTTVAPSARNSGLFVSSGSPLTPEILAAGETTSDILGEPPYWDGWRGHYDYLLWIGFG
ncbi:MAG: hypothetical protein ACREFL_21670, partial [Stellaceae bacterium]